MSRATFSDLVGSLRQTLAGLPDRRTGQNLSYAMEDFGLGAFAVFFTQSPSFLAHQKAMQTARGANNAQSLFGIQNIPGESQIRQMLDPVAPQSLFPVYDAIYDTLRAQGILQTFRGVHDSTLIAWTAPGTTARRRSTARVVPRSSTPAARSPTITAP